MRQVGGRRTLAYSSLAAGVIAAVALGGSMGGCDVHDADSRAGGGSGTPTAARGGSTAAVTVLAASSLTESFREIARRYEAEHPGSTVTLVFDASTALARSILQGAPADVFAAASAAPMAPLVAGSLVETPQGFARNRLQIAVPPDNPGRVKGIRDLGDPGLRIAFCAAQMPCGSAARRVLDAAHVVATPDSLEPNVKAAVSKVRLGEVDAALVYRTDVIAEGGSVTGIDFPEAAAAVNEDMIATVAGSHERRAAEDFVALVRSPAGQAILARAGFERP